MTSLDTFIHFGCWNYDKCGGDNAVTAVTRAVKQETESGGINYVIVAGDNYYPIKNKKTSLKIINPPMLTSGLDCLPDIPTYVLFGNHDLDNSVALRLYRGEGTIDDLSVMDQLETPRPCEILKTELEHARPNMMFPPRNFVTSRIDGNTMVLMIDTTMYDINSQDESGKEIDKDGNLVCYNEYYGVSNRALLMEQQNARIMEILSTLEDHVTNIMFVGHHPLLYPKAKKNDDGKVKLKIIYLQDFVPLLLEIYARFPTRNYFYLCADYHNYQVGTVILGDMRIQQYIVGTGGTKLDPPLTIYPKPVDVIETDDHSQYVLKEEINEYGYLRVTLGPSIVFEFVRVAKKGGTRRRRRRTRTRRR